jgi:5-methylcytosine-specific restriction endonuclease McrA
MKAYYEANKEKLDARSKAWYEANKEKRNAQKREYYKKNKAMLTAKKEVYRLANKGMYNALKKAYKERKKKNDLITTQEDKQMAKWVYTMASKLTEVTGTKWHVDHIKPLSKGGMHSLDNIQIVPALWNLQKNNTTEERWNGKA